MTIQDWGAIGEVISAVAVVVTLAYLATQIRYARLTAADASRQARATGVREMQMLTIQEPAFREAWNRAQPGSNERFEALGVSLGITPEEAGLVWHGCCAWYWLHWGQFRSMKTEADERELQNIVRSFYSVPPMSIVWAEDDFMRQILDPDFVAWVDETLAGMPAAND